jgi:hypothetical protein
LLDDFNESSVAGVDARGVAGFEVADVAAVLAAKFGAGETLGRRAGFVIGKQVMQAPGEDGNGASAFVLENQQIELRVRGHRLHAEESDAGVENEALPGRPDEFAGAASVKGVA